MNYCYIAYTKWIPENFKIWSMYMIISVFGSECDRSKTLFTLKKSQLPWASILPFHYCLIFLQWIRKRILKCQSKVKKQVCFSLWSEPLGQQFFDFNISIIWDIMHDFWVNRCTAMLWSSCTFWNTEYATCARPSG